MANMAYILFLFYANTFGMVLVLRICPCFFVGAAVIHVHSNNRAAKP